MPNGYGTAGDISRMLMGSGFDPSKLPDYLRNQFVQTYISNGGDDGGGHSEWRPSNGQGGGTGFGSVTDSQGRVVNQIGARENWQPSTSDGGIIDPSKAWEDADLGWITPNDNIRSIRDNDTGKFLAAYLALVTAGASMAGGLGGMGVEGAAGGLGEAAGTGAFDSGILGGLEGGVTPSLYGGAVGPWEGAALGGGAAGGGTPGLLGEGGMPSWAGEGGAFGDGLAPVSDLSTTAGGGSSLLGDAGQWAMNNPLRVLGMGQTVAGLLGGNHGGSNGSGYDATSNYKPKGGTGTAPQSSYYVNPYTLAQLQRSQGGM